MAGANSNIQVTSLDFDTLKQNFLSYLQQPDSPFKDYNFEGSALNTLVDLLTYNTQYNSYYLNMVANEMFLDSAIQRSSVISHAKLLDYTPKSAIAPTATVNIIFTGVTDSSLTLPPYMNFSSGSINGVNYVFVNPESYTVNTDTANGIAFFSNVEIKQGVYGSQSYTVNSTTNPSYTFEIADATIDTTTLMVEVQASASNTSFDVYTPAASYSTLNSTSQVYFLQESLKGTYEIYFGDGIIGKNLTDGNIVKITYLSTEGIGGAGANSFVLLDTIQGQYTKYAASQVLSVYSATQGGDKESIDSIKFQAPKSYAAQGRAVTKDDYITAIQQNTLGYNFDAVSVWGGEENSPPAYGQVFIAIKPSGAYSLTTLQKTQIIDQIIKPISVLTVTPNVIDPDYTYLTLGVNAYYKPALTNQTSSQVQAGITTAISNFAANTLNTFNSTFNSYELLKTVQNYDQSIITSDFTLKLQKKFLPNFTSAVSYNLYYNTPLKRGVLVSGVTSYPALQYIDPVTPGNIIDGVFIEEVPQASYGIESISISNPGFNYITAPTITISGDGKDATAEAIIQNGRIQSIVVTNSGNNYTQAIVTITNAANDTSGQLGAATVTLQGQYGTLRTYYNNTNGAKTILNSNIGSIDYINGIISLNSFSPYNVDNPLGQLAVAATPVSTTVSSAYNRIITVDPYDPAAISVTVIAKNS